MLPTAKNLLMFLFTCNTGMNKRIFTVFMTFLSTINKVAVLIYLCETQFDTPLFEGLGKLFQFLQITRLLQGGCI